MTEPVKKGEFTREEVWLALRNHGMHLEGLRYPITPAGMHYLLIHFDIPLIDPAGYELEIGGLVRGPSRLTLDEIKTRPAVTVPVAMECGGNGRAHLSPRPISAPWHEEAIGCAEWTGTPLRPILEEAGVLDDAVEVLFSGHDRGIDAGVEHAFERSLPVEEAMRDEVLLVYAMNGHPLPPQHGSPLRLIVPDWYGMASVKWLRSVAPIAEPFSGVQQAAKYRYKRSETDPGTPVTRKHPRALMVPPGIPDYLSRVRHVRAGKILVEGRAWSGFGPIERVEFSSDGGHSWEDTGLGEPLGPYAWRAWSYEWDAREPGEYELCARATDASGKTQPADGDEVWNYGGYGVNAVQRVPVIVG
jgi:sulfane dehydrogenase subunit SoxC